MIEGEEIVLKDMVIQLYIKGIVSIHEKDELNSRILKAFSFSEVSDES